MKEKYQNLIKNLRFYHDNLAQFEREYQNKYLLIWEQMVAGIYPTYEEAMQDASFKYDPGTYLLKQCQSVPNIKKVYAANGVFQPISTA